MEYLLRFLGFIPRLVGMLLQRWRDRLTDDDRLILDVASAGTGLIEVGVGDQRMYVMVGNRFLSEGRDAAGFADLVASVEKLARLGFIAPCVSYHPHVQNYRLTTKGLKETGRRK
jgi:hypothetical protein